MDSKIKNSFLLYADKFRAWEQCDGIIPTLPLRPHSRQDSGSIEVAASVTPFMCTFLYNFTACLSALLVVNAMNASSQSSNESTAECYLY